MRALWEERRAADGSGRGDDAGAASGGEGELELPAALGRLERLENVAFRGFQSLPVTLG